MINQSFSIMDNRVNNGGAREGAGRKPKSKELELIESLYESTEINNRN